MSYDAKLKLVLNAIIERKRLEAQDVLPEIGKEELYNIIEDLYKENMIQCQWASGPVNRFKGGALIDDNLSVTRKGHGFLSGTLDTPTIRNQFNVQGGIHSSNIGDYGTVNNNFGASLEELKSLIQELQGSDLTQGKEMVEVIETEEIKPGFLSRFDKFLGKYPNIASTAGKLLLTLATAI